MLTYTMFIGNIHIQCNIIVHFIVKCILIITMILNVFNNVNLNLTIAFKKTVSFLQIQIKNLWRLSFLYPSPLFPPTNIVEARMFTVHRAIFK